jgi:hypothetical protein
LYVGEHWDPDYTAQRLELLADEDDGGNDDSAVDLT